MRRLLWIVTMFVCWQFISATQLTTLQKKAKVELFKALQKNNLTNVSEYADDELAFVYGNNKYRVGIHAYDEETLYLTMSLMFHLPEEYWVDVASAAAFEAASGKPVCSYAGEGVLAFSCEMYAKDAKPFIAVIPEMVKALASSAEEFEENYEKAQEKHVVNSMDKGVLRLTSDETEFIYPQYAFSEDPYLYIKRVQIEDGGTVIEMISYNGGEYKNCTLDRNAYLLVNGKKYNLIEADGISYKPIYTDYPGYQSGHNVPLTFKLYFPELPKGTSTFDFYESADSNWNIKGIRLTQGQRYAVINGKEIETSDHKWVCTQVEVQDGRTIVTKTVEPKTAGTYMYSSQDEFIEDADTGRKYYLQNSSLGFEGSPEISYDKKIITFYEIYPALPASVKKINISSGTQYYAKELQIC